MRRFVRSSMLVVLVSAAWPALADDGATDADGCHDHPLVTRFRGFHILDCDAKEFDAETVVDANGERQVEGKVTRLRYGGPESVSRLQLKRNYENALKKAGFATASADEGALYMRRLAKGTETWVALPVLEDGHMQLAIVEVEAMKQEVAADAAGLLAGLQDSGRVAVYGISFDTGKATLRPDSEKMLGEVLKLLQASPDLTLRIEGHTDDVGKAADNLELSRRRATTVRLWLVGKGVDGGRLTTDGFGDTRPVAPNDGDEGRAKNRRVELVKI
jgi:OmpA-OmpF porin, OOP family